MRIRSLIRNFATIASVLVLIQACSTSHSTVSSNVPQTTHTDSTIAESGGTSWAPQIAAGRWRYLIRDSSTVSINNDTTARVEPIESTTIYSMSIVDSNNSLTLSGHVDSLLVNSRLPNKSTDDTTKSSDFHTIISRQGQLTKVSEPTSATCTGAAVSPSARIIELLTVFPAHAIRAGDKWADTISTITCHGKVPLAQTVVREYELLDLTSCQRGGAKVQRVVSSTFNGTSAESVNHLSAGGSGTSTSLLCIDRNTGALLESDGESRLDLTVTTIRGVFPFTQKTNTHIEVR
jgi:hypothetical protein